MTITEQLMEQFRCPECGELTCSNVTPEVLVCRPCKRAWVRKDGELKGRWGDAISAGEVCYALLGVIPVLVERIEALELHAMRNAP